MKSLLVYNHGKKLKYFFVIVTSSIDRGIKGTLSYNYIMGKKWKEME